MIIDFIVSLPFFLPAILVAISLLTIATWTGLYGNIFVTVIGHIIWTVTIVFITLTSALTTVDKSIEEAAKSLGASGIRTFFEITLPLIKEAVVASALFTFALSINEFLIAYFTSTPATATLTVYIWSFLRGGLSPITSVCSLIIITLTLSIFAYNLLIFQGLLIWLEAFRLSR